MLDSTSYPSRSRLSPGTRLNGIYEVDHLIASGGMGEVYKGHTVQTGDAVAIKVLLPDFAENEAALGLFRREASALHKLQHDAIVRYYVFTIEPMLRRPYLAMEFVEGQSLSELIRREPLTYEAVRLLLRRVASGLHVAHERGIVHRDVSPDNIMIPGGDVARAKIIDFGIARSTLLGEHTIIGGGFAGKYNYVSPEQLGLFGGDVQAKSDIYSLALVLIEALTGQPVDMGGTQAAVLDKRRKVPDLGAVDLRLRPLLEKMLQPDPAARPESMAEVAAWPLASSRQTDLPSRPNKSRAQPLARSHRRWNVLAGVLGALTICGAGAAYFYWQSGPEVAGKAQQIVQKPAEQKPAAQKPAAPADTPALTPSKQVPAPAPTPAKPQEAALPPPQGKVGEIERYIGQYNGGDCFFITPHTVSAKSARIDGYGASQAPFETLDDAFKRAHGFEADIDVRQVTAPQCPAVTFLGRLRGERARAPRLQIGATSLKNGEALTGSIEGVGDNNVALLLVTDEGLVQDLSPLLKPAGDGRTFNLRMQRSGASGAQPQLLLAVTSPRPLETLRDAKSPADQLFPLALVEVARTGQAAAATVRYFKLNR